MDAHGSDSKAKDGNIYPSQEIKQNDQEVEPHESPKNKCQPWPPKEQRETEELDMETEEETDLDTLK